MGAFLPALPSSALLRRRRPQDELFDRTGADLLGASAETDILAPRGSEIAVEPPTAAAPPPDYFEPPSMQELGLAKPARNIDELDISSFPQDAFARRGAAVEGPQRPTAERRNAKVGTGRAIGGILASLISPAAGNYILGGPQRQADMDYENQLQKQQDFDWSAARGRQQTNDAMDSLVKGAQYAKAKAPDVVDTSEGIIVVHPDGVAKPLQVDGQPAFGSKKRVPEFEVITGKDGEPIGVQDRSGKRHIGRNVPPEAVELFNSHVEAFQGSLDRADAKEDRRDARQMRALANAINRKEDPDALLTVAEAQAFGVPFGSKRRDVFGKTPKFGAGRPPTEGERRAFNFYSRAKDSVTELEKLEKEVSGYSTGQQLYLKHGHNLIQTDTNQVYRQAQRQFTEARLRKDSGAAIPEHEFENDRRTYFVEPGDSKAVIERKRKARSVLLNALKKESGRAYEETDEAFGGEGGGTPSGGTVRMRAPNGQEKDVPADKVELYKSKGAVVVQ